MTREQAKKLIPIIVELSEIPRHTKVNQISKQQRLNLVHLLKNITFTVKRYRPIEEAIITSGGIKVSEINASTMESKIIENLFFFLIFVSNTIMLQLGFNMYAIFDKFFNS